MSVRNNEQSEESCITANMGGIGRVRFRIKNDTMFQYSLQTIKPLYNCKLIIDGYVSSLIIVSGYNFIPIQ